MLDLFTLLVFLLVLVGTYTVRALSRRQRRDEAVAARLAGLRAQVERESGTPAALLAGADSIALPDAGHWPAAWPWLARRLASLRAGLAALGWLQTIRRRLAVSAVAAIVVALVLTRMTGTPASAALAAAPLLWLAGCTLAYQSAMAKYLAALARTLPEAIDGITRICRAGVPLHSAFSIAADHVQGPLAAELREIDHWLKLGVPLKQVMQNSAARVPLAEYRFFAVILIISQESGGRLGDTLERLAATLRARAELGMKVQAKTSEARASAKIVALLVPGVLLYMYLNAPADFRFMFNDPAGIKVMAYAALSVGLGLLITHVMVKRIR
ncbi:type II secretion system F family protein [Thauera linaloolentis]|nr:type II secretion system F family protein [Thauera linaloolentis]MCM8565962.1 type II secretion system F family protein [Thauera linaloolentis]